MLSCHSQCWVRHVSLKPCSLHVGFPNLVSPQGEHYVQFGREVGPSGSYQIKPLSLYPFALDVPHHSGNVSCSGQSLSHYQMAWCSSYGNTSALLRINVPESNNLRNTVRIPSVALFSCQKPVSCKSLHTFSVKRMSLKMNSQGWVTGLNTIQVSIDSAPFILGHFVTWGHCALHWYGPCSFYLWGQDEFGIEMSSWNQCVFKTGQKHIEIHGISSCSIWNMSTSMLDWWMFTNVPASCLSLSLSNHWSGQSSFGDFFLSVQGTDHWGVCCWSSQFSTPWSLKCW